MREVGRKEERKDIQMTNKAYGDCPGGPVVKNLPSNAGYMGSIPGQGTKIPHAAGQLNLRAATTEHEIHNYRAHML